MRLSLRSPHGRPCRQTDQPTSGLAHAHHRDDADAHQDDGHAGQVERAHVLARQRDAERARILGDLHDWMARENATIMAVICLIIGAKLIGDAISALTT